ncbi:MAG TPA: response regulator [Chloroflexota bacterium]
MSQRDKTVVVVEDQDDIRDLEAAILASMGYRVVLRERGEGLVGLVRQERPSLILLDLVLPDRHGNQVLMDLAADPVASRVPVVVVSAYPEQIRWAPPLRRVVPKPFDLEDFERAVREAIDDA